MLLIPNVRWLLYPLYLTQAMGLGVSIVFTFLFYILIFGTLGLLFQNVWLLSPPWHGLIFSYLFLTIWIMSGSMLNALFFPGLKIPAQWQWISYSLSIVTVLTLFMCLSFWYEGIVEESIVYPLIEYGIWLSLPVLIIVLCFGVKLTRMNPLQTFILNDGQHTLT